MLPDALPVDDRVLVVGHRGDHDSVAFDFKLAMRAGDIKIIEANIGMFMAGANDCGPGIGKQEKAIGICTIYDRQLRQDIGHLRQGGESKPGRDKVTFGVS